LGKKGTVSDIALYNYAKEFTLEIVDPVRYPNKPLSLFQTILMADVPLVIVSPEGPDIHTGEFGILLNSLNFTNGLIALVHEGEYVNVEKVSSKIKKMFKTTVLSQYPILDVNLSKGESITALKQKVLEKVHNKPTFIWAEKEHSRIDVDHVFPVKGVGTVILGRIRAGEIQKGETLHVFPSKRNCVLRSIQINDVDYSQANEGSRVGLALRGLLPKDIERGFILSNSIGWTITSHLTVQLHLTPYSSAPEVGKIRHLIVGLQAVPARILSCVLKNNSENNYYLIELELEKEIAIFHQEPAFFIDLNSKPKTIGCCKIGRE